VHEIKHAKNLSYTSVSSTLELYERFLFSKPISKILKSRKTSLSCKRLPKDVKIGQNSQNKYYSLLNIKLYRQKIKKGF